MSKFAKSLLILSLAFAVFGVVPHLSRVAAATYTYTANPALPVPDASCLATVSSTINVPDNVVITGVDVSAATTIMTDDMDFWLQSPAGTTIQVHSGTTGPGDSDFSVTGLTNYNGQSAAGIWTLHVCDKMALFSGTVDSWTLTIDGNAPSAPSAVVVSSCNLADGRLNAGDCGAPVAVYCNGKGVDVYKLDKTVGTLIIHVTEAEITAAGVPASGSRVLSQEADVILSRLADGYFQVNAVYTQEPKPYVIAWDACPMTTFYHVTY